MGVMDTFPGISPSPSAGGSSNKKEEGLPVWAIALIIIFLLMLIGGGVYASQS